MVAAIRVPHNFVLEVSEGMKVYSYKAEEIGLSSWPEGELRLAGTTAVSNPYDADVFVCPGGLHIFETAKDLAKFPYMEGNEDKHVFFHCSDHEVKYHRKCLFIRCNTRPWNLDADPN